VGSLSAVGLRDWETLNKVSNTLYSLLGEHQPQDRLASLVVSGHVFVRSVYSKSKKLWFNFQALLLGMP